MGWIIVILALVLVIILCYIPGTKKEIIEEPTVEPVIQDDEKEIKEKVVIEDFENTLSNEDFVKKEPQTERVLTEHIKSVIDKTSVKPKKTPRNQRKGSKN